MSYGMEEDICNACNWWRTHIQNLFLNSLKFYIKKNENQKFLNGKQNKHSTKEIHNTQMTHKHIKGAQPHSHQKNKLKPHWDTTTHPTEWLWSNRLTIKSIDEDVKQ